MISADNVLAKRPHRFTAGEFLRLDVPGRTELLGGFIYDVSPRNEPHRYAVEVLNRVLTSALLSSDYAVRVQDAVAVPSWRGSDAPEIDVAILHRRRYDPGPTSADALAFIEVTDTTYTDDRGYKIPLYVDAGVPAWIVNVNLRQVEFYGGPQDLVRKHGRVYAEADSFEIVGIRIAVRDLF